MRENPYIGKAHFFIGHKPPRAMGTRAQQDRQAIDIVDAAWCDVDGRNAGVMIRPVVKVDSRSEESDNYWLYAGSEQDTTLCSPVKL